MTIYLAKSLVAVDVETGERVWHFQTVHHGLWDYDPPAAPILMDITVDGREIKAITQLTKQAFAFVFDRETGGACLGNRGKTSATVDSSRRSHISNAAFSD